jgi:hypothetical protein
VLFRSGEIPHAPTDFPRISERRSRIPPVDPVFKIYFREFRDRFQASERIAELRIGSPAQG